MQTHHAFLPTCSARTEPNPSLDSFSFNTKTVERKKFLTSEPPQAPPWLTPITKTKVDCSHLMQKDDESLRTRVGTANLQKEGFQKEAKKKKKSGGRKKLAFKKAQKHEDGGAPRPCGSSGQKHSLKC